VPGSVALLVVVLVAVAVGCRREAAPPNVLLVSIDSLRADRLGAWGNPRDTSPTLDRLAAEGVRFAHALSPTAWTLPSHVTMLTGLAQRRHQVINVSDTIAPSLPFLPETFARRGYATVGFYSGPFLHPAYGFGRGFDRYVSCQSPAMQAAHGPSSWALSHGDHTNPRVLRAWKHWLHHQAREPFFAFVHMWDVHYDYVPPGRYRTMFDATYTGKLDGRRIEGAGFPRNATARDVAHLFALYDGEIRHTDATIGRMLSLLERRGLLDRTIVVVTADHGEEFLEHGDTGHSKTLFEEVLHVPLIVWARRGLPRRRTVTRPVSLEDVTPTILAMAGVPPLSDVDGRSLVPLLHGEETEESRPVASALYATTARRLVLGSLRSGEAKAIYDHRFKTVVRYDLGADPREKAPMPGFGDGLEVALEMRVERSLASLDAARTPVPATPPAALPPAERERLRALGYIE
jgi:arylsulfatase A-like enzyme